MNYSLKCYVGNSVWSVPYGSVSECHRTAVALLDCWAANLASLKEHVPEAHALRDSVARNRVEIWCRHAGGLELIWEKTGGNQ